MNTIHWLFSTLKTGAEQVLKVYNSIYYNTGVSSKFIYGYPYPPTISNKVYVCMERITQWPENFHAYVLIGYLRYEIRVDGNIATLLKIPQSIAGTASCYCYTDVTHTISKEQFIKKFNEVSKVRYKYGIGKDQVNCQTILHEIIYGHRDYFQGIKNEYSTTNIDYIHDHQSQKL